MSAMPDGLLTVKVEVWPLAADDNGIWLLGDTLEGRWGAWVSDFIPAYTDVHSEVIYLLSQHHIRQAELLAVHSTSVSEPGAWSSWHADDTSVILTYMAPVRVPPGCFVPEMWPASRPVTKELFGLTGMPEPYKPVEAPMPRDSSILLHGLRHLKHLIETDTDHCEALGDRWDDALDDFTPILATMYHRDRELVA